MLNPNWMRVYDPKDIADYDKLMGTAPPVQYPFQHQILYRLLERYYRTNKGNQLHPDNPRHLTAFFDMVQRTMEELKKQVILKEDYEAQQWEEQRLRDEHPLDKLMREDELRKDSSLKKRGLKEDIDLGRFWISPLGSVMSPSKDLHHGEWMMQHPEVLNKYESGVVSRHSDDIKTIMEYLFADGWIRISGGVAEMYSEFQMPKLARFLETHVFDTERDSSILVLHHDNNEENAMKIGDIISKYGDNNMLELQASQSSDKILLPKKHIREDLKEFTELQEKIEDMKDEDKEALKTSKLSSISFRKIASNVPNPLRKNLDYSNELGGPEWQNRVKTYEKLLKEKPHAETRSRKGNS